MREQINSNPLLQVALIGLLLLGAGFFAMSSMGGGEEEEPASEATVSVAGTEATPGEAVDGALDAIAEGASSSAALPAGAATAAPPPPAPVIDAFDANQTVVLLFVRDGGIDDRIVKGSLDRLGGLEEVTTFVVPASKIARYASIAQGVAVDRVPALVVIRPKHLDDGIPVASVSYGFQSPESIVQAVVDAGYTGPTVDYHP